MSRFPQCLGNSCPPESGQFFFSFKRMRARNFISVAYLLALPMPLGPPSIENPGRVWKYLPTGAPMRLSSPSFQKKKGRKPKPPAPFWIHSGIFRECGIFRAGPPGPAFPAVLSFLVLSISYRHFLSKCRRPRRRFPRPGQRLPAFPWW